MKFLTAQHKKDFFLLLLLCVLLYVYVLPLLASLFIYLLKFISKFLSQSSYDTKGKKFVLIIIIPIFVSQCKIHSRTSPCYTCFKVVVVVVFLSLMYAINFHCLWTNDGTRCMWIAVDMSAHENRHLIELFKKSLSCVFTASKRFFNIFLNIQLSFRNLSIVSLSNVILLFYQFILILDDNRRYTHCLLSSDINIFSTYCL